ncbi:MarR family winged helix-turn-helix transcriptional regulator [Sphingomonas elodea]|uniref:MarR family winged helix-turn-helix transcriptional regulator n=1 Tax=Sphingomonas elodea TaxID=179878 RepID=UPI000263043B|nr:MarR family transcriptional regulator [Sphingomonas elodea]
MAAEDDGIALGPLDTFVGYHMRRSSALMAADFNAAMAGTGIRQVLFGVLSIIAANPGINQGRIGAALGIQRANMVTLINELMDAGFILRTVSPEDRRAFVFQLTDLGSAAVADGLARIRRHEDRLLAGLSSAERETLITLLKRIEAAAPA